MILAMRKRLKDVNILRVVGIITHHPVSQDIDIEAQPRYRIILCSAVPRSKLMKLSRFGV